MRYFLFTVILTSDLTISVKSLVIMSNEFSKTINMKYFNGAISDGKYGFELPPCGMIFLQSFMKIGTSIQVMSRLFSPRFEMLLCWYY
jgi:hypothetical protein